MAGQTYTVKSGDNLSTIAKNYGTTVGAISGYRSGNPNLIYPGEVLTIGGAAPTSNFQNTAQVQSYTNNVQNNSFVANSGGSSFDRVKNEGYIGGKKYVDYNEYLRDGGMSYDAVNTSTPKVRSLGEIQTEIKGLLPTEAAPAVPNLLQTYQTERANRGIDALESGINDLTAQERELLAVKRERTAGEMGKPVALNVIQGRVNEVERQENERIDVVQREKAYMVDQVKSAYSAIDTIVKLTGQDYEYAKGAYDTKFNQALSIIQAATGIQANEQDQAQRVVENARANLTIYADLIKSGNVSIGSLPASTQLEINKLEVQSGLGVGFLSTVRGTPLSISTREADGVKYADVITRNPDGSLGIQTQTLGSVDKPKAAAGSSAGSVGTTATGSKISSGDLLNYTKAALSVIATVDKSYQTVGGKLVTLSKNDQTGGDRRLSPQEANIALQQVIDKIGDSGAGQAAFKNAIVQGGYTLWKG